VELGFEDNSIYAFVLERKHVKLFLIENSIGTLLFFTNKLMGFYLNEFINTYIQLVRERFFSFCDYIIY